MKLVIQRFFSTVFASVLARRKKTLSAVKLAVPLKLKLS